MIQVLRNFRNAEIIRGSQILNVDPNFGCNVSKSHKIKILIIIQQS